MLPTFSWVMHRFNLRIAYQTVGVCLLVMLLVCIFLVKSDPEEHGCAPDNDWTHTLKEFKVLHEKAVAYEKNHHLTTAQLLKTKQMWQIGVVNGLVQMAITVLIVQFIPNMIACGFSASTSTAIYSVASILGGVGSYLWGLLDQKVGVKKATVWMCLMHAIAGAAFAVAAGHLIEGPAVPLFGAFIVGSILGVSSNYVGSFTATVFGRYGYARAFGLVYMVVCALRSAGYALIGVVQTATGSYTLSYWIAGILSLLALALTFRIDDRCIG